jgi:hypothetical protein
MYSEKFYGMDNILSTRSLQHISIYQILVIYREVSLHVDGSGLQRGTDFSIMSTPICFQLNIEFRTLAGHTMLLHTTVGDCDCASEDLRRLS